MRMRIRSAVCRIGKQSKESMPIEDPAMRGRTWFYQIVSADLRIWISGQNHQISKNIRFWCYDSIHQSRVMVGRGTISSTGLVLRPRSEAMAFYPMPPERVESKRDGPLEGMEEEPIPLSVGHLLSIRLLASRAG